MEKVFFAIETQIWSRSEISNEKPWCERSHMEYISFWHSSSCSSSCKRLHGEFCDLPRINPWNLRDIMFQATQKVITDHTEITAITTIDWRQRMWRETTQLTDRAVQFATAKTYVFSDSVLCLRGISTESVKAWESKIKSFLNTFFSERVGSDRRWTTNGIRVENFQGVTTLEILDEIQKTKISEF